MHAFGTLHNGKYGRSVVIVGGLGAVRADDHRVVNEIGKPGKAVLVDFRSVKTLGSQGKQPPLRNTGSFIGQDGSFPVVRAFQRNMIHKNDGGNGKQFHVP